MPSWSSNAINSAGKTSARTNLKFLQPAQSHLSAPPASVRAYARIVASRSGRYFHASKLDIIGTLKAELVGCTNRSRQLSAHQMLNFWMKGLWPWVTHAAFAMSAPASVIQNTGLFCVRLGRFGRRLAAPESQTTGATEAAPDDGVNYFEVAYRQQRAGTSTAPNQH